MKRVRAAFLAPAYTVTIVLFIVPLAIVLAYSFLSRGAYGGVVMIAVKHTPVIPVPSHQLSAASMAGSKMAVNVVPSALTPAEKEALTQFARSGGKLLNGPPDWRFPAMTSDRITLGDADVKKLDEIWKELNEMTGRRNLGARLFNVSSMSVSSWPAI